MTDQALLYSLYQLRRNWSTWYDLDRGAAIVRLRDEGISLRKLAAIAGCSEGLIRHYEIIGRLPYSWKQYLVQGYSARKVVGWWRAEQRRQLEADE